MSQPKAQFRRDGFTFKEFFVAHDRCAMKVGTDGVMLGAWSPVSNARHMLDIGTGSGLLALMLAQRTPPTVMIDAVELDEAGGCAGAGKRAGLTVVQTYNCAHCRHSPVEQREYRSLRSDRQQSPLF